MRNGVRLRLGRHWDILRKSNPFFFGVCAVGVVLEYFQRSSYGGRGGLVWFS